MVGLPVSAVATSKSQNVVPALSTVLMDEQSNFRNSSGYKEMSLLARAGRLAFVVGSILAIALGFKLSEIERFTPAEGVGYSFGIIGGSAMLLLLVYPLRKRFKFMSRAGSAPAWFRFHMVLGIIGPIFVLFHANFSLGSTNSNVALFAMLTVAISGIAGRYFYEKIHNGLYGAKTSLQELLGDVTALIATIEKDVGGVDSHIAKELMDFGVRALRPRDTVLSNLGNLLVLPFETRFARSRILAAVRKSVKANAVKQRWTRQQRVSHYRQARLHVRAYLHGIVKASELTFYEKLFGHWHVLHVPLFFLLIITSVAHVIAVHLY